MNRERVIVFVMIICLCGCSLAPEYIKPTPPIPEQWPQGDAYRNSEGSPSIAQALSKRSGIQNLSWQEFFTDKNMAAIIKIALKNNRDLKLAVLNVERARALYGIQRAELLPEVNAVGDGGRKRTSSDLLTPGYPKEAEQYGVGLSIASWEIDLFGRIRSLKKKALEEYLATDEARRATQIALVSEIGRSYLTLAADRENLEIAKSTLENQQTAYNLIKNQHEVGLITRLDLCRAQTPLYSAREDVARFQQVVAQDQNALNLLVGSQVPEYLLPVDISTVTPPREISPGISSLALFNRPDIIGAEHRLKGAYASISAARAAFFPTIFLTTSAGTASDQLSGLFSSGSSTWSFAPKIALPIFDARTWAALRVSKAEQEIALTQYEKTIQIAFREVADTLAVKGTVDEQMVAHQALVEAASETYRLSEERYNKGLDRYLSVLDAHRSLYAAKQGLVALRLKKVVNQVTLYAVLGGGGEMFINQTSDLEQKE